MSEGTKKSYLNSKNIVIGVIVLVLYSILLYVFAYAHGRSSYVKGLDPDLRKFIRNEQMRRLTADANSFIKQLEKSKDKEKLKQLELNNRFRRNKK